MKKIIIHRPGGHDRLQVEEHSDPRPAAGEVLVDVEGIGVNFADPIVRMGLYASAKEYVGWPITPGFELAGTVLDSGEGVASFCPGDAVIGLVRFGAYASRVCVPSAQLFPLPEGYTAVEGAAFSVVHLTAWYALHRLCVLEPGATALVHSAAGGVGGALLQLCKLSGVRAVGVVGAAHKVEAARALGAAEVIDKSRTKLWSAAESFAPDGYDAIFDGNGYATLKQGYEHLAPEGRIVAYGFHSMFPRQGGKPNPLRLAWDYLRTPRFHPLDMSQKNRSVLAFNLSFLFHRRELMREAMDFLLDHAEAGRLARPEITTFPLDEVARAHAALESGRTVGKLVLVP